jgi:SAM-dependent methyltransferase
MEHSAGCRACGAVLTRTFVDLGLSPLCESYLRAEQLNQAEVFYPLHVFVCERCYLVQLQQYVSTEHIFSEYAYFSSYSESWLEHARRYTDMIAERLRLGGESRVVEVASNDGYLLRNFVRRAVPVLGIEPAANVAEAALRQGIPTRIAFFGRQLACELANEGYRADLIIANNVLAQVPDLNDFVAGIRLLLKPGGVATIEFPHLLQLMRGNQFDTIYHEHFSYFSLAASEPLFAAHLLKVFDIEELPTHGGSLRLYLHRDDDLSHGVTERVAAIRQSEAEAALFDLAAYDGFATRVEETKRKLLAFLIEAKQAGQTVVGYGAPGKGNTLLNYCGIRTDFLDYTVDRNPYKQGRFTPGTHVPIFSPEKIFETKPAFVLILPWNIKDEIIRQMGAIREWGGKFVVPIPEVALVS